MVLELAGENINFMYVCIHAHDIVAYTCVCTMYCMYTYMILNITPLVVTHYTFCVRVLAYTESDLPLMVIQSSYYNVL